ncbi:MAG: histidine kinase, partial [Pseudolysinimonas sp.]
EIARLAVNEERARLARDLHDSLGHSLTVVAVKSELAGKLISRDPSLASAEIADIEKLARDGLVELRAAVAGYRDANVDNELVAARTALRAAGVIEHLPHDASAVDPELRGLFGWVVREGVTNVIRHAGARNCWIDVTRTSVRIRDDGATTVDLAAAGSGLHGLRERAAAAGATLTAGPRPRGGFQLEVSR